MNDNDIISFYNSNIKGKRLLMKTIQNRFPEFYNYIINRFDDLSGNEKISEIIYRIINKIGVHPKCVICGKPLYFFVNKGYYQKLFCSKECEYSAEALFIIKEKVKRTKQERYGDPFYNNREQYRQTNLERFGYENPNQNKEIAAKAQITRLNTHLERYGVTNSMYLESAKEKLKQTCLERYGVEHIMKLEETKDKIKQTKILKYGYSNFNNIEKLKQTCLERYGVDNPKKLPEIIEKTKQTCLERYGVDNPKKLPQVIEKGRLTCLEKYGVDNPMQLDEIKKIAYEHRYNNNEYVGTSKIENQLYDYLVEQYESETKRQYNSKEYPFFCDFYLPKYNTYIELQGMWTHGKHPFNKLNEEDINLLNIWKEKALYSNFYKSAIHVWTISDPYKRKTAIKNNLKLFEIFSNNIEDIKEKINKYFSNENEQRN